MNKLDRIQAEIDQLRGKAANVRYRELERVARLVRRKLDTKRGGHPTFVNKEKNWNPLTIPNHPGSMVKRTVHNILDQLEDDLMKLWQEQEKEGVGNGE
jgi:hypothetical protein